MNDQDTMTRALFLAQYQGEWAPSDGLWLGMDFEYNGSEYRFQTDSMYNTQNQLLPDGREARYYMYKKERISSDIGYILLSAFATTQEVIDHCIIDGRTFGQLLDDGLVELRGQD